MLLDIKSRNKEKHRKSPPSTYVEGYASTCSATFQMRKPTRISLTVRFARYTPYNIKGGIVSSRYSLSTCGYAVLSLVLALITVSYISNYKHKSHLHESKSYSNIFSVTSNIISVVMSVSVNTVALCTTTSVLLLLGVLQCCEQRVPGILHHISYRTGIQEKIQNCEINTRISIRYDVLLLAKIRNLPFRDRNHVALIQLKVTWTNRYIVLPRTYIRVNRHS
jgi:hypothetical protein